MKDFACIVFRSHWGKVSKKSSNRHLPCRIQAKVLLGDLETFLVKCAAFEPLVRYFDHCNTTNKSFVTFGHIWSHCVHILYYTQVITGLNNKFIQSWFLSKEKVQAITFWLSNISCGIIRVCLRDGGIYVIGYGKNLHTNTHRHSLVLKDNT